MIDNISVNAQSSIRIDYNGKVIRFDPYQIDKDYNDADYIFITHPHYDHYSEKDIDKVKKENTKIIVPKELESEVSDFSEVLVVEPNKEYTIDDISFTTTYAYNLDKYFHKKESNWVGYIVNLNNEKIYVSGDTDIVPELYDIKADIAMICIGGTYTCDYIEASELINKIHPKYTVPIHYKTIVGSETDADKFGELVKNSTQVKMLLK